MRNKNMCTNISNSRVIKNGYLLRLSALTSEVTLLTTVVALDLCLVLLSTLALLALCYLAIFSPRLPAPLAFLPCSLRLGLNAFRCPNWATRRVFWCPPHALCLKLEMTRNISKSLDILTMCQNKLHLPPSRFRQ